ncbi:transketolase [Robertmurraya sp. P23]|uniref:transketolase n=1 Tax=Robertmurraya sp. P23 TaxID=3436931 RepID=UPI003D9642C2
MVSTISVEQLSVNAIRTLSIDMIEKANSGHPGLPMGAAPMAYVLWTDFLKHNPKNSKWFDRDRFILSAGHGSALLYSLLHLSGYNLTIDDLKSFRKFGSKTPGHPEVHHTDGVEATTGPLGQGIAMSVGMSMAERFLAAKYNKDNLNIIDHYTYALVGDGDLMEGISHEAASLAGHLKLGKLIVLYDSNDISLDGDLNRSFSDNTADRFKAYGWQVLCIEDGNDLDAIRKAIQEGKDNSNQPTLIEVKTVIGYGSPNKAGSSDVHGAPLGTEEIRLAKQFYQWDYENFVVPEEVYEDFTEKIVEPGKAVEEMWNELYETYKEEYPDVLAELESAIKGELLEGWEKNLSKFTPGVDTLATRASSGKVLNEIAKTVPYFLGGSADLAGSNKTTINNEDDFSPFNFAGRNIWFGVREFAMGAILNGMALHGGVKVYGGTFFVFSDYLKPAIRLSALMNTPVTYVLTHDSIAVGEDGPTHEPVEQLVGLRSIPNLSVIRPADGNEVQAAWRLAVESKEQPTALILTRQNLPTLEGTKERAYEGVKAGAYVVSKVEKDVPDALLIATGSEVQLAIQAQTILKDQGIKVNVVSMPSWDRFEKQDESYKKSVLPDNVRARVSIEMASALGWKKYVGDRGVVLSIDTFGASGDGDILIEKYGFTVENIVSHVKKLVK